MRISDWSSDVCSADLAKYRRIVEARGDRGLSPGEIDDDIVRLVAQNELDESKAAGSGSENVFTMVRRIGKAKAHLAADYAVQLDRKSTRLNPVTNAHLVCRLLLEKKKKKQ